MILLYMTVCCVVFGLSTGLRHEDVCYGGSLSLSYPYTSPIFEGPLYFTPNQGSRRLLMDGRKSKDPRVRVNFGSVKFMNLKEGDVGIISISKDGKQENIIKLTISDCAQEYERFYGESYSCDISRNAEYLEFNPLLTVDTIQVMWNRSDPQANKGGRGHTRRNIWEISGLTQADNGFYSVWSRDNTLMSRVRLTVKEHRTEYEVMEDEQLLIQNHISGRPWSVTFTGNMYPTLITLIQEGRLLEEYNWATLPFSRRISLLDNGIEIRPVRLSDSGTFEFKDPHGYLVRTVEVTVRPVVIPTYVYIATISGAAVALIVCCCCVKKCCCKKSSSKRNESPAVYYRDQDSSAGPVSAAAPASGYAARPVNPHFSTSTGPSAYTPVNIHVNPRQPEAYNPVNIHVNPRQPEVVAPARQGGAPAPSAGSDFLSSDTVPTYELKGLNFLSGQPLNSDSTFCNVYNSDKLNFQ